MQILKRQIKSLLLTLAVLAICGFSVAIFWIELSDMFK